MVAPPGHQKVVKEEHVPGPVHLVRRDGDREECLSVAGRRHGPLAHGLGLRVGVRVPEREGEGRTREEWEENGRRMGEE